MKWFDRLKNSLTWKLIISYLVVIVVGVVTMALAAETVAPTTFNRHMLGMQQMMGGQMGMQQMDDALMKLVEEKAVTPKSAYMKATDKERFEPLLKPGE